MTAPRPAAAMLRLGALAALVLLVACDSTPDDVPLVIDLLGWFDDTPVLVEFNGETVFDERATTGKILATAGGASLDVPEGEHRVRVTVNGTATGEIAVHTDTTVTVAVYYNPEADVVTLEALPFPIYHR